MIKAGMIKAIGLAGAIGVFVIVATANSGGYRFGISDQAFYVPAVALKMTPALFPRDRSVLAPQMRFWLGGDLLAAAIRWSDGDEARVFLVLYLGGLAGLAIAAMAFARAMGASGPVTGAFLALLTLRHRIARTGANSLEGYMHPRMIAFALGVAALAALARRRFALALVPLGLAVVVHPTTALWFGGVWIVAVAVDQGYARWVVIALGAGLAAAALLAVAPSIARLDVMDARWLAVLEDKDYLFATEWPAYAWLTNLGCAVVVGLVWRRRARLGVAAPGETALVAGALALVAAFLFSLPLTVAHVAIAVQLQVNRVFWVVDFLAAWSLAWWLVTQVGAREPRWARPAAVAVILTLAAARGYYVLSIEAGRALFQPRLPDSAWIDAMRFLRTQPVDWHVLADPAHGWKYGVSVRVAAERDVLLEAGKDTSMSMYDRGVAARVAERERALAAFDQFTAADVRELAERYRLDVFVDRSTRALDLPVLYRNAEFVVYGLH